MIQDRLHSVSVITFSNDTDSYGEKRKTATDSTEIQMAIYPFSNTETADIRFREVTNLGLTKSKAITDANEVIDGTDVYLVQYVLPSVRYNQVFLRKK